jgi:transcriptional regulator
MDPPVMQGMMRQILPFALHVTQVDGTWKLGQNKPDAARVAAAGQMAQNGIGSNVADLAAMMQSPPADQLD